MHRRARILPWIALGAWLAVFAAGGPSAWGQEPEPIEGPALMGTPPAAAESQTEPEAEAAPESAAEPESGAPQEAEATEPADAAEATDTSEDSQRTDAPNATDAMQAADEPGDSETPATDDESTPADEPEQAAEPPVRLSKEMVALRDYVRRTLAAVARQPVNTRQSTPADVLRLSLAFGCEANVGYNGPSGKRINAIGCLCWNYPCAGYRLLRTAGGSAVARVGYGLQSRPAEFLAVLAQSRVPADYEIRIGESRGTVADLVEFEQRACRSGTDQAFALIGLSHYLDEGATWENDLGQTWSVERLLREELDRSASTSGADATRRLMGLSCAVRRRRKQEAPMDGPFLAAQRYLAKFHDFALELQNEDGSWHPNFFANRGPSQDAAGTLRSTGHVLEWLVSSLPEDRLQEPRVVRSVTYLAKRLGGRRSGWNLTGMSAQDAEGLTHAAHALRVYDERLFQRAVEADPDEEAPEAVASRSTPE